MFSEKGWIRISSNTFHIDAILTVIALIFKHFMKYIYIMTQNIIMKLNRAISSTHYHTLSCFSLFLVLFLSCFDTSHQNSQTVN